MVAESNHLWIEEFPGAITVCDSAGTILEMNVRALEDFREEGGQKLIGTNLLDCHPEPARTKLRELMETQQINVYTTEKGRVRKLFCQAPWYKEGEYCGFIELSLEIPSGIPHFVRDPGNPKE